MMTYSPLGKLRKPGRRFLIPASSQIGVHGEKKKAVRYRINKAVGNFMLPLSRAMLFDPSLLGYTERKMSQRDRCAVFPDRRRFKTKSSREFHERPNHQ